MKSRGSYQVTPGEDPSPPSAKPSVQQPFVDPEKCQPLSRPDTSFRDCVLSLALVIIIIAILVLAVHPWDSRVNNAANHGADSRIGQPRSTTSTTTKATTTIQIERKVMASNDSDYSFDDVSSSTSSSSTTSTTSTIASQGSDEYDYVDEKDDEEQNSSHTSKQPETTPKTTTTSAWFSTVHRAANTMSSKTETSSVTKEQFERKPLSSPIPDYDDIPDPTSTPTSTTTQRVTDQPQVEGDQRGDDSVKSTVAYDTDSTDADFGLAVGNYEPTTSMGDDGITTDASETEETTRTTRLQEKMARLLVSGTTLVDGETTTTQGVEEATTTPHQQTTVEEVNPKPHECTTPACKKQAARMLGLMDHSTEPCQDFYQYACGGLRNNALLSEEDAEAEAMGRLEGELAKVDNSTSSSALRKFRRFYDLCVEDVGDKNKRIDKFSTSAKDVVENVGKLHTNDTWNDAAFDLTDLLTRLMLQHSTPLIDVTLDVSSNAAGKFALKLTPPVTPSLLRPGPARPACLEVAAEESDLNKVYEEYSSCTSNYSRYLPEVEAAVKALRLFPQANSSQQAQLVLEIQQTIEWDVWYKELLETMPAEGEKRRQLLAKEYQRTTVRELQDKYPMVDWRKLICGLLNITSTELPDSTEVQVYFQAYLDKLFSSLQNKESRTLHNTLLAMYARDLYVDGLIGGPRCQRKDRCLRVAVSLMEDVASALYLASFSSADLDAMEQESREAFIRLSKTLELQLQDTKWLDEGSRSDVVAKLREMRIDASGGRGLFTDLAAIDQRMNGIDLDVSNDLIKLSAALTGRYRRLMYSLYDKNPNNAEAGWTHFLLPFSTTAVSVYGLNSVMVPFGLLTWPLYDPAVPRHITLARLGFVIAHEMAHHFDSIGIHYRAGGGQGESVLMRGAASNVFDNYLMMECPVHNRYNYEVSHTEPDKSTYKFNLNGGILSRNERLADDTASALSLDTGLRWQNSTETDPAMPYLGLTPAQEHFLAVAQMFCTKAGVEAWRVALFEREHPPPPHRVNDLIKNSAAFARTFSCPVGADMSPTVRCEVFPSLPKEETEEYSDFTVPQ